MNLKNHYKDYNINFHTVEALVSPLPLVFFFLRSTLLTSTLIAQVDTLDTDYTDDYKTQEWTTYKVRGQTAGIYKQAGRFSYLRVYGAGHSVPAYDVRVTLHLPYVVY